jgi:predicted Zn-dependent protease
MSEPTEPNLDVVARTERFVDALAKREPVDSEDRALAGLLEDWRDELRAPVPRGLCTHRDAVEALNRGRAARRRSRRNMALVATVAATLLSAGGFVAVMGQAQPGDTLYGVHTKVFGEPASVHDERIASSAQTDLNQVEQMISSGRWDEAQDKLDAVTDRVQTVKDGDRKQDLLDQVNLLHAKVANRDPKAAPAPTNSIGG